MLSSIRPQDVADIIIMSSLVYLLYSWFRNTKALQVVIGLGFVGVIYIATKYLGLLMTSWVLQEMGTTLFVLIIVIFQNEIRQALYRFSLLSNLFGSHPNGKRLDFMDLAKEIFSLASTRTGAILVFQREEPLDEYLLHGVPVDAIVSGELIGSIFRDGTPLHDGAAVICDGRISEASCHLPLSTNPDVPQYYGTRHRAGLGLSERSDAAVVVVSEERGEVSLALNGQLHQIRTPEQLSEKLFTLVAPPAREKTTITLRERLFSNLWPKVATVLLVALCWVIVTSRQGGIVVASAPIKFHNLPDNLVLMKTMPEEVEIRLKFFSSLTTSPKDLDLVADVDLARIREGASTVPVRAEDVKLPLGVQVTEITPAFVKVVAERSVRKNLRVKLKSHGILPNNLQVRKVRIEPATVAVEGPEHLLHQYQSIETEDVDLSGLRKSVLLEKRLVLPAPQIKLLQGDLVRVALTVGR